MRVHAREPDHLVWAGTGAAVGMQRSMVVKPIWYSSGRVNNLVRHDSRLRHFGIESLLWTRRRGVLVHSKWSPKRRKIIETWKFQGPWDKTGLIRLVVWMEFRKRDSCPDDIEFCLWISIFG